MFKAIVFACVMQGMAANCFLSAEDSRGPYADLEDCKARTVEMAEGLMEEVALPVPWFVHAVCVDPSKTPETPRPDRGI